MCNSDCPPPPPAAPPPAVTSRQYHAQLKLVMSKINATAATLTLCNDAIDLLFRSRASTAFLPRAAKIEQALRGALLQTNHLQQTISDFVNLRKLQTPS